MLSDRSYMRSDYPRQATSVLTWILSATVAGFLLQNVYGRWLGSNAFESLFALTPASFKHGHVWTLITYTLLQDGILSLLLNGLAIFLLGRELIALVGARRFLAVYLAAAVIGGLAWAGLHFFVGGSALIGSSSCVMALFILFACFYPDREITFLLFFVLPVTVRPKYLAWILVGIDLVGFLFSEIPGRAFDTPIAHSSHLGGMLVGWVYFRFFHANNGWDRAPSIGLPAWLQRREKSKSVARALPAARDKSPGNVRAEVDRILDKINSDGFGALTEAEKRLLDEAKDLLSRP
jgi:membrane associated rhomboid family serine protease